MEIKDLRITLQKYIKGLKNQKAPNRFMFAKVCGYHSFKALQRDMATKGDEGRDFLEELDNEIYIYLMDYLNESKKQSDVLVRKHLLSIAGLQEKQSIEFGLNSAEKGTANIDFALMMRVNKIANKEIEQGGEGLE